MNRNTIYIDTSFHKPEAITHIPYAISHGKTLHFDFLYPRESDGECPLLLWVKGSGWRQQVLSKVDLVLSQFVEIGFCVAVMEYNTASEAPFPAQIINANQCLDYLKEHAEEYGVDMNRIFLGGDSSGGHTALMQMLTQGEEAYGSYYEEDIRGCIDLYAPIDLTLIHDSALPNADELEYELFRGDIVKIQQHKIIPHLYAGMPPVLIFHGDKDRIVPYEHSVLLADALDSLAVSYRFITIKDADHGDSCFWQKECVEEMKEFLLKLS